MNGDDIGFPLSDLGESGLGHLKVLLGEIAPAAIIGGEPEIGWTEISGSENNGRASLETPQDVVNTSQLITSPTGTSSVEQYAAQPCTVSPICHLVKITIPTSSFCYNIFKKELEVWDLKQDM